MNRVTTRGASQALRALAFRRNGNDGARTIKWGALAAVFLLAIAPRFSGADTLRVGPSRTYTTIQAALDAASKDDIIRVDPSTYTENLLFPGVDLVLTSMNPLDPVTVAATIIDGGENGPVVTFAGTETSYCVLEGFTITGGLAGVAHSGAGGGIRGNGTLAVIRYNVIRDNEAGILTEEERHNGFGAGLHNCDGLILGNTIRNNSAGAYDKELGGVLGYGGGLYGCGGPVTDNTITDNEVIGYGGGLHTSGGEVSGNTIAQNSAWRAAGFFTNPLGGGLYQCDGPIQNNTISGNRSGNSGGGLYGCDGTIAGNAIEYNYAHSSGGGLAACGGCIENSDICYNSSGCEDPEHPAGGKGSAAFNCDGTLTGNHVAFNTATGFHGYPKFSDIPARGAAFNGCDGLIAYSTIICNTSEGYGGAFAQCGADVEDCLIRDNCAMGLERTYHPFPAGAGAFHQCGGGIRRNSILHNLAYGVSAAGGALRNCSGLVDRNVISHNTADGPNAHGGGLWDCGARITNNVIVSNVGYEGGGLGKCTNSILNNTIMNNMAVGSGTQGAGLYSCTGAIKNCIIWGNKAEVGTKQLHACSTPTYSCLEGSNYGVASNITDPPVLNDPEHGDFHLDPSSPCIDAGGLVNVAVDYDGHSRPTDGSWVPRGDGSDYDMGADEWDPGVPVYSLLMQSVGSGTIDPPPGPYVFADRSVVIVSATPKVGWVFDHWNGVIPEWLNPAWIEMSENRTITAVFVPGEGWYRLTIAIDGDGTTDPTEGEHVYEGHSDVSLRAAAAPGWYFDHWEGDSFGGANPLDLTMDGDKAITAVFLPAQAGYRTLTTAAVGGGTIDPPAGEHLCVPDSVIPVRATANSGWLFHHWEGHLTGSENPTPLIMNSDKSVTAVFIAIPETHTLTTGVVGYGTVYPPAGTYQFVVGSAVDVQAAAGPGWRFEGWGGQVDDSSENPTSVTMDADKVATAVFVENPSEDIDGDEFLTAVDVQLVINAALGISIAPFDGDVDGDGSVTAIDVQRVINAVLGLL